MCLRLCRRLTLNSPILDDGLSDSKICFTNPGFVPKGLERLSSGDRLEVPVVMGGEERKEDPFGTVATDRLVPLYGMRRFTLTG